LQLERLRDLPSGTTVLDVACGADLALGWVEPSRRIRYIGVDSSSAMLDRASRKARRRGFDTVELHLADVESMPVPDAVADVCLLYNALHCFPEPEAALDEVVRCLEPGPQVLGSMLVRGAVRRADRLLEADAARGGTTIGPGGTIEDLRGWLDRRFRDVDVAGAGALAVFRGVAA